MESQLRQEGIQETPTQSTIMRLSDGEPPIRRVTPLATTPEEGREAISPHAAVSKGFAQMFGLDIRAALLTVMVDLMLFTGDIFSLGALIPMAIVVACGLGFIVYKMQTHWYGDDHNSALIKAMTVALLTAIPVPLAPIIAIPSGIIGIAKVIRLR